MRNILIFWSIVAISASNSIFAQTITNVIQKRSTVIDEFILSEMKKRQIPGLVYGICGKNGLITVKSYGLADVQNQSPVKDNTVFELSSLTKQFTAVAIMLLVQQDKIKLSDPIKLYLDDCPSAWYKVTIRHLLTHTSGLPSMGNGYSGFLKMNNQQCVELLWLNLNKELAFSTMKTDTLDFEPGERFSYSDVGYELLGHVVNKVTGSYRNFIQKEIFDKTGMKDSYILDQTTIHPFEARGYTLREDKLVNIRRVWDVEIPSHSGVFSNVKDLSKWDSVLNTNNLLTSESKSLMWAPNKLNNGEYAGYGFGWFVKNTNQGLVLSHTGITGTEIVKYVGDSLSVIVLTNLGLGFYDRVNSWGIAPYIGKMLIGYNTFIDSKYITRRGFTIKKTKQSTAKKLVGEYELSKSKLIRKIYLENDKLMYNNGSTVVELAELSDGSFIKLGIENEEILEVVSKDFKKLKWKGSEEILIKLNK